MSAGLAAWTLAFQASPIILTNGLVNSFPGRMLPIMAITEALNLPLGLLGGGNNLSLNRLFASFQPIPGASIIDQQIGNYPFANQTIAANAVIAQPLAVSMLMTCPVQNPLGYFERLAVITALRFALNQHNAAGGTYIVATPSYIYTNCVMTGMQDASTNLTKQPQNAWQLDFVRPLITLEEAEQAQNGLFSMITSGVAIDNPAWSGLGTAASIPGSIAGVAVAPIQSGAVAATTSAASALAAGIAPV